MSRIHEQKTFKSVNDQLSNPKKGKIPMRSYSFSWKKENNILSAKESRIFPNIPQYCK